MMHILSPHMSCVVSPEEFASAMEQGYKQIYIISSKGILKHHQLRGTNRFIRLKVDTIPGYQEVVIPEAMSFLPAGKIPYTLYEQILAFFRRVMEVKSAELEAMIHILWNQEQGYHLGVPPQTIGKASVSYDWSYIPDGTSIIVDIHSHNTMGAFFSGTDNNDDRNNVSFSGVFGKLKDKDPATVWRFNYFDKKFDAKVEDIFDAPVIPQSDVPAEWLDKVTVVSTPSYYKGGHSNQGNVGRSYDHLKQYQFPKGSSQQSSQPSGPRSCGNPKQVIGSPRRNTLNGVDDLPEPDMSGTFFGHDIDAETAAYLERGLSPVLHEDDTEGFYFDPQKGIYVFPGVSDSNFASVNEDALVQEEIESLGKTVVETVNSGRANEKDSDSHLQGLVPPGFNDARYEEIASVHGVDVADAWSAIDTEMVMLEGKDDLNISLISDMFNLTSDEGQSKLIRTLYEQLSRPEREKIEQNGF